LIWDRQILPVAAKPAWGGGPPAGWWRGAAAQPPPRGGPPPSRASGARHLPIALRATGRIITAATCLLLLGCSSAPETASATHPTIVSLNPCTDAILAEVADPAQLLAISHYSHDPRASSMPLAEARRFRATGGTVEEVLALDPDVVVASAFLPPATAQAFDRLGIRVETFGIVPDLAENAAQVRRLAALAGHPERGEALLARIDAALASTRRDGATADALLWQTGGIVPGEQTLIARLLAHTGFASHSAARGLGQASYVPLEQVLADPPQVVLAAGSERMLTHPVLRRLDGVRYERLDPALLYCGGPTVIRAVERLAEIRASTG
jgi:iron complex transport system substrate-binding protein